MATSPTSSGQVLVAFGSNLGDSPALVRAAMDQVERLAGVPLRRSSLWTSTPVDCPTGSPIFTNAAAVLPIPAGVTPEDWLTQTQRLEVELGRTAKVVHNEARRIDIDLIAWGQEVRALPRLTLPHPRAHQRRFVLQPLAELVPDFILPGQTHTIAALLAASAEDPAFRRIGTPESTHP